MFRPVLRVAAQCLALSAAVVACGERDPAAFEVALPTQLGLSELTLNQRALLRATVSLDDVLAESPLAISSDVTSVSGRFPLPIEGERITTLTLRLYGRFGDQSPEVLLARVSEMVTLLAEGATEPAVTGAWESDGAAIFDVNRNGRPSLEDLRVGVDPAPPGAFVALTESALQLTPSTDVDLQRQIIAVENRSPRSVNVTANVLDAPGVYIATVEADPSATTRPQRFLDLGAVPPFARRFVAVSFIPPSSFFLTGAVLVRANDPFTLVDQSTSVTLIGSPSGALQPIPNPDDPGVLPTLAAYAGTVVPFPRAELFSGLPISSVDPSASPPEALDFSGLEFQGFPADAAYYVRVPAGYRFYTLLSGLSADIDLTVLPLVGGSAQPSAAIRPGLGGTSPEAVELPSAATAQELLLLLGVVEPARAADTLTDLPFSLTAHVVAGPEFAATSPITPSLGPNIGGTAVQILGSGFAPAARVFFGGAEAGSVAVNAAGDTIDCVTPALTTLETGSVPVPVVVSNPAGPDDVVTSMTLPNGYVYIPPSPTVVLAQPATVSTLGGTPTRISGQYLSGDDRAPAVLFGTTPAAQVTWLSDGAVLAIAPPAPAGTVDVTVETHFATGTTATGTGTGLVTFADPSATAPTLTDLNTDTVAAAGGDMLTLVGDNFVDGATVLVGGTPATSVMFMDAMTLHAITPPGDPGFVDVTVINPDGQTATLPLGLRYVTSCLLQPGGCVACGNGMRDPGEQCDMMDLGGTQCTDLSFDGGPLACDASCFFDLSGCTRCGNGGVEANEECEPGMPPNLDGETCASINMGFVDGTLDCTGTCTFDTAGCHRCGDSACQVEETNALCAMDCAPGCGDMMCMAGETCLTCPFDCNCNTPFAVNLITGDGESAIVGQSVGTGMLVRVVDSLMTPMAGLRVEFTSDLGVILGATQAFTNVNGDAAVGWRAGNVPGPYTITAEAFLPDNSPLGPPVTINVTITDVNVGDVYTVLNRDNVSGQSLAGGVGVLAQAGSLYGLAIDGSDNLYVVDWTFSRVLRLTPEGRVSIFAGGNGPGFTGDGGQATSARLRNPTYAGFDLSGRLLISDGGNSRIRRVDAMGNINTVVGGGAGGDNVLATSARLGTPNELYMDSSGVLWFAEQDGSFFLRRVGTDQVITTAIDVGTDPVFQTITDVAELGGTLIVAGDGESNNFSALARFDGVTATAFAGNQIGTFTGTTQIRLARIGRNSHVRALPNGELLVSGYDGGGSDLYRVDHTNTANLIATGASSTGTGNYVAASSATVGFNRDVVTNSNGDIFFTDGQQVRMIRGDGFGTPVTPTLTITGAGQSGTRPAQNFALPVGLRVENGLTPIVGLRVNLSVDQPGAHLITQNPSTDGTGLAQSVLFAGRRLLPHVITARYDVFNGTTVMQTFDAGTPEVGVGEIITVVNSAGLSGSANYDRATSHMVLNNPVGITLDSAGNIYVQQNNPGALIDPDGYGTQIVGMHDINYSNSPSGIALGSMGELFYAHDSSGAAATVTIRVRLPGGSINLYAGGSGGCTGAIPITSTFLNVTGLAADSAGNLYITDDSCNWLRMINQMGTTIVTLAETPCSASDPLNTYEGLAVGPSDEVYVSGPVSTCSGSVGYSGDVVLRYDGGGSFTRVAGGGMTDADNIMATTALVTDPFHLTVDAAGDLYIVERSRDRIRKVTFSTGLISTVAGTGTAGPPAGVEVATAANLDDPQQIDIGPDGNLYIADSGNDVIRMVVLP